MTDKRQAGRDLPPEARGRRSARRHRASAAEDPASKNGKRVALIGAGPASLTVANDLLPLGYEVTIFEKQDKPGGLMRTNIPSFRLAGEGAGRRSRHRSWTWASISATTRPSPA